MKIDGATVVVTGGARRIGRHISLGLAQRGANVVINYQSSEAEAHEVVEACVNMGACAQAVQADISSKIGVETVRDAAISKFGGVDIERYYSPGRSEMQIDYSLPWLLIPAPLGTGSPEGTLAS